MRSDFSRIAADDHYFQRCRFLFSLLIFATITPPRQSRYFIT